MTKGTKLSLLLNSGENNIYLDRFVKSHSGSKMRVKNAAIYWNFKNVRTDVNDTVVITPTNGTAKTITFEKGYWTFHMISEKLAEDNVKLERNRYNNTCKIFPKNSSVNLKNLGTMLGFSKNATVNSDEWTTSPNEVDVNLGMRYVTVECNHVDVTRNFDQFGKKSKIVATYPVTSEQSLNSSITHYRGIETEAAIVNGDLNHFEFFVSGPKDLKSMLEIYIE